MTDVPLLFPSEPRLTDTVAPLLYPLYAMTMQEVMAMEKMITHQDLHDDGKIEEYSSEKEGRVIFISHQWLGHLLPDPRRVF